jgi:hypothetical protein
MRSKRKRELNPQWVGCFIIVCLAIIIAAICSGVISLIVENW